MDLQEKPSEHLKYAFYQQQKYSSYLKGLLKPFKGKGDFELLEQQARESRDVLNTAVREVGLLMRQPPWSLFKIMLRVQPTLYGAVYLRWGSSTFKEMGVHCWEKLLLDPKTPPALLEELREMETMRITLNMQVSACHYLHKSAKDCVEKMEYADGVFAQALEAAREHEALSAIRAKYRIK